MAGNLKVCELDPTLTEKLKKFRFRKETNNAAIVLKVDMGAQTIILDKEYEDLTPEELAEELPASQPRFVLYSYAYSHDDGRKSYPLCFIFVSPPGCNPRAADDVLRFPDLSCTRATDHQGCKPEQQMMYSGSQTSLVQELQITKVFEVRSVEDLTEEWLREKLKFFK